MTPEEIQEGVRALFAEVMAVMDGKIDGSEMTALREFDGLVKVETFAKAEMSGALAGVVLRFATGDEYQIEIFKTK